MFGLKNFKSDEVSDDDSVPELEDQMPSLANVPPSTSHLTPDYPFLVGYPKKVCKEPPVTSLPAVIPPIKSFYLKMIGAAQSTSF